MSSSCSTTRAIRPWRHSGGTTSEFEACENWGSCSVFLWSGLGSGAGNPRPVKPNRQLVLNNFIMMPNKLLKRLLSKRICFSVSATPSNVTPGESSPHTLPKWADISCQRSRTDLHVCTSSGRLGLTCILIKHYLRTISRSIWKQPARFNWYLCCGNGVPLAYAAVGLSGSGRRDEQSRENGWKK